MLASGPYNQAAFLRGKWVQPEGVLAALSGRPTTVANAAARQAVAAIQLATNFLITSRLHVDR